MNKYLQKQILYLSKKYTMDEKNKGLLDIYDAIEVILKSYGSSINFKIIDILVQNIPLDSPYLGH